MKTWGDERARLLALRDQQELELKEKYRDLRTVIIEYQRAEDALHQCDWALETLDIQMKAKKASTDDPYLL